MTRNPRRLAKQICINLFCLKNSKKDKFIYHCSKTSNKIYISTFLIKGYIYRTNIQYKYLIINLSDCKVTTA